MEDSRPKFSLTAVVLPAALLVGSASILFLTVQSANLATLRTENDRELFRQAELAGSLKALRDQVEQVRHDVAAATAEQARLAEEKKSAQEVISRAAALGRSVEQLRAEELATSKRVDELRRDDAKVSDQLGASRSDLASLEGKLRKASADRLEAEAKLAETLAKESAVAQKSAERERALVAREKELSDKDRLVAERDAEVAVSSVGVKRLESQKRQLEVEIAERKAEVKALAEQLAGLDRDRVAAAELQRLRSERSDLTSRIETLRQDLRSMEASLREKEAVRDSLERAVGELLARRAAAETTPKKP